MSARPPATPLRDARFASACPPEVAVARLAAGVRRRGILPPREEVMIGRVTERRVVLERHVPRTRNAFEPVFVGRFQPAGTGSVLAGSFAMHWSVRAFLTFWFGFAVVWTGAVIAQGIAGTSRAWLLLPVGVVLGLIGAGLVAFGRSLAQTDIAWLSGRIAAALDSPRDR
ncbi:hypothetical protein MNO14_10280 [Luteimonas sp. S4-F44]|uniref:hypothetical protein n=1 Tax=Luteimonas sp. S4-F44 TaxID=2925842 RepID=UPI001F52C595|nr:hypothetical protein [Luteimonas sp. S4-F44]UNK41367.1 hypothetical protein MNO14_10280 [Luteimonas sp. S4-F44]